MSQFLTAEEALATPIKERFCIWGPGVAQGNLIQIVGERGVSKTRFAMSLCMSMAHQRKFLAWPTALRPCLYIDGELGTESMRSRIAETKASLEVGEFLSFFRFVPYDLMGDRAWNLSDPMDQARYEDVIQASNAAVVVFDNLLTLARAMSDRDSDFAQWERISPWLSKLRSKGLTVIIVHHTGKDATKGGLGTSTREITLDAIIALRRPSQWSEQRNEFELFFTKSRDFERRDTPPMLVEYVKGEDGISRWFWKPLQEDVDGRILAMSRSGMTRAQIARELGVPFSRVSQVIPYEKKAYKQDEFPNI